MLREKDTCENFGKRDPRSKRKHIDACLDIKSQYVKSAGFDKFELINNSSAGLNFDEILLGTNFLGHNLQAPLMIAPMTGGSKLGLELNRRWARAAEYFKIPMGVGSQRLALENPEVQRSFLIREYAPNILLFANLGAAQIIKNNNFDWVRKSIDMISAQAIFIHINPLQEIMQKNGDKNFSGLLKKLENLVREFRNSGTKILVREVGFGFSTRAAKDLIQTGIDGLDCAGAGGTSWTKVESMCAENNYYKNLGELFGEWGIPTAESILNIRKVNYQIPLIATGGIRTGVDIAKALCLGANLASMAQPMLLSALESEEKLFSFVAEKLYELKIALYVCGVTRVCNLGSSLLKNKV